MDRKREVEAEEEGGEAVDELGLRRELVGVPHAVEEAFPELLHVVVVDLELCRQPCFEEDPESSIAAAFVA